MGKKARRKRDTQGTSTPRRPDTRHRRSGVGEKPGESLEPGQLAPPATWLPAASRDLPVTPDALFTKVRQEDRDRPAERHLEVTSSGNSLPPWFAPHEPEPPVIRDLRPGDVLDAHARLAETMTRPPRRLIEFFDSFVQDTLDKAGSRGGDWEKVNVWAGMFWPAQSAAEWCGVLARQLRTARTYQVTAPMTDLVDDAYQATADHPALITRDAVPWPAGFAWLDKPVRFTDRWGNAIYNRAYSWDIAYLPGQEGGKVPGIRVISWSHPLDRDSYWTEVSSSVMEQLGGLGMGNAVLFPLSEPVAAPTVPGQPRQDSVPRWLRCLWAALESTVSATSKAGHDQISHGIRRRAARSLDHAEVSVVVLRRTMTLPAEPDGTGHRRVNWTCRWFVDGFWRHSRRDPGWEAAHEELDEKTGRPRRHHAIPDAARTHCVTCQMPVSWVASFGKGPPGLPYRQHRVLHRLQR